VDLKLIVFLGRADIVNQKDIKQALYLKLVLEMLPFLALNNCAYWKSI
jgi:hypothetical protein